MNWAYNIIRLQCHAWSSCNVTNVNSVSKFNASSFFPTRSPWVSYEVVSLNWSSSWCMENNYYNSTKSLCLFSLEQFITLCFSAKTWLHKHEVWFIGKLENNDKKENKKKQSGFIPGTINLLYYLLFIISQEGQFEIYAIIFLHVSIKIRTNWYGYNSVEQKINYITKHIE